MSLLETWVETPVAEAIGWTLLHSLWEGALIAAALAAALFVTRSPRSRYIAACAALLAVIATIAVTFMRLLPADTHGAGTTAPIPFPVWGPQADPSAVASSDISLAQVVPWLAPLWAAGVSISYLWLAAGWISVLRLRSRGVCAVPKPWRDQLRNLTAKLNLSRPIRLLESSLVDAPMVLGHFRPLIVIPIGLLTNLPAVQVEAILLHELAHIRRHDFLVNALQRSVESLLFYHPAVWWISSVIRAERENCCDDIVVATSGQPHEYATALAALEQTRWSSREPAVAATGGSLVKRIRRLLYPASPNRSSTPVFAAAVLIASALLMLAAWQTAPAQQATAAQVKQEASEASPYVKWLNQDVVYIISGDERTAFQALNTDEERQRFIEQFWERRDPTPGTAENEFQKEHHRRIEYSNRRFPTASGRPGWQTDRGRMYIVYGPPDEIEAHPVGAPRTPYPFEVWRYWHVEGIGNNLFATFVDRTKSGNYEFAPGSGL